jgi:hypothetical protein
MKFLKFSLFIALLVAACLPAAAQTQQLRLNIPFDFIVKGKTLPAGHYVAKRLGTIDDGVWTLESDQAAAMFLTNPVESPKVSHNLSLIFLKSGDQYSLLQIWDGQHFGRELLRSNVKQTMVADNGTYVEVGAE